MIPGRPNVIRIGAASLGLGAFAGAMWFAWLGWDHEYYVVAGVAHGPYRGWQVIGCGLAVGTAAALAQLWVRMPIGILALAAAADIGFAIPWATDAARHDETGLWIVGLVLLLTGGGIALVAVLAVTEGIARRLRRPVPAG